LFYRVAALAVYVPPLRERPEDIAALISHFVSYYARRNERAVAGITAEAIALLQSYPWPGNVRELAAEMERLVLYTDEGCYICAEDISERMRPAETRARAAASPEQVPAHLENMLEDYERRVITETLRRNDYNVARAAAALGLGSRQTLYKKLKRLTINAGDFLQDDQKPGLQLRADPHLASK
jgi:transcriptional regulator with PAS, ATPase and Fis domain